MGEKGSDDVLMLGGEIDHIKYMYFESYDFDLFANSLIS